LSAGNNTIVKAGNRRGDLHEFLARAVLKRPELNPQVFQDGSYYYIITQEGMQLKQQYLSNSMEGQQFAMACRCDKWHVRYGTLHSISAEYDLFCQWCECGDSSWEGSNKDAVSAAEVEAMEALQSAGLDHTTACQVMTPYWHGRMDFYHIPSKTAMQADGSSHFEFMHQMAPQVQLLRDIDCCESAWNERGRLLRIHHKYANSKEAMIVAWQLPYERFVMLAGPYNEVDVWYNGAHINYIDLLRSLLAGAEFIQQSVAGCVLFYQPTL
jgi:hypothetical protein